MKAEYKLFVIGLGFFVVSTIVYAVMTGVAGGVEPVGTVALGFSSGLALLVAFYLYLTSRRVGMRPEDRVDAEVHEGAGELGFFSPHSIWPVYVGAASAVLTLGLVFGTWMVFTGIIAVGLAVIGLVFEYYRGEHSH